MFTVEQRDKIREAMVAKARGDKRIVAGAFVGGSAEGGDRWSDIDMSFGVAAASTVGEVLGDWTTDLASMGAVQLFDVSRASTVYRVFLFPGNLQVDLSFAPEGEFGALGPRFSLIFGKSVQRELGKPPAARELFGYAVHHLVRTRICIERRRLWEAEYLVSEARDRALELACLKQGLPAFYARGYERLPQEVLLKAEGALVGELTRESLMRALKVTVELLLENSDAVGPYTERLTPQLRELGSDTLE